MNMEIVEVILPFFIVVTSLAAFMLGGTVRAHVHVLDPFHDPATMTIFTLAMIPGVLSFTPYALFSYDTIYYWAFLAGFILCYSLAYVKGEVDMVYVNVHTIISDEYPDGAEDIDYVVYYWDDRDGRQYMQEQSMKEILKTVLFGIKSPLKLDVGLIKHSRHLSVKKFMYPAIELDFIDLAEKRIDVTEVKKGPFTFKVRSYTYVPAPSCISPTETWLVSAHNQDVMKSQLSRKEAELLETKRELNSSLYGRVADLLVDVLYDKTPGAEVFDSITKRLEPEETYKIDFDEGRELDLRSEGERKSFFRRRRQSKEEEE